MYTLSHISSSAIFVRFLHDETQIKVIRLKCLFSHGLLPQKVTNEEKNQDAKKPGSKENWGYEGKNVIILKLSSASMMKVATSIMRHQNKPN